MNGNPPAKLGDRKEKQTSFLELINLEKLLWATIQHKGISHSEVQDLYRKARSGYEKIILNDYQSVDLQEVEYSLWKLHYKHIDEYRKKIKKVSASSESTNNLNNHVEGFKLFLSEVSDFYTDLIAKFRRICSLFDDTNLVRKTGGSISVEPAILQKCRYVCHRFLVCLGDLSRYRELCKKPDCQKWATAATYYLEASTVWPHSGNPQNQLALLATYIGDDFLALYHCIRSLAIKEPFPDARDNIMLLFEKNKSSQLQSLSTNAHIDFSKPLKRLSSQIKSHSSVDSTNINKLGANEHVLPVKTDLWPLFVRMISFFLVKPSFEDLPHTFASTMKELEALLALTDIELNSSLEPYCPFDPSKKGPYRALQAVSILIFIIHNLIQNPEKNGPNGPKDEPTEWAWTFAFSFLGHIIERCVGPENRCSLLPAVLVFVEWYVGVLDFAEICKDEKVCNAKSYFFGALIELLNGFEVKELEPVESGLWEDHELRGFEPVAWSNRSEFGQNPARFEGGYLMRVRRVFIASIEIADRLKGGPMVYDRSNKTFSKAEIVTAPVAEEEEVILFKPLTRVNSEPIRTTSDEPVDSAETSDDGLRRSASLFAAQNGAHEPPKRAPPYSGGPPSLNAWVLNRETVIPDRTQPELAPIEEVSTYVAPVPSAPVLPEEPAWLKGGSVLGAPPHGPVDHGSTVPGFVDAYRPPVFGLSSSEWLYRYNLERGAGTLPNSGSHWAATASTPAGNLGFDGGSRYDVFDRWGNPLLTNRMVYFENPRVMFGYQRPSGGSGGGGGGGGGGRVEQPPVLQNLKEREWQLQSEFPYMGN